MLAKKRMHGAGIKGAEQRRVRKEKQKNSNRGPISRQGSRKQGPKKLKRASREPYLYLGPTAKKVCRRVGYGCTESDRST